MGPNPNCTVYGLSCLGHADPLRASFLVFGLWMRSAGTWGLEDAAGAPPWEPGASRPGREGGASSGHGSPAGWGCPGVPPRGGCEAAAAAPRAAVPREVPESAGCTPSGLQGAPETFLRLRPCRAPGRRVVGACTPPGAGPGPPLPAGLIRLEEEGQVLRCSRTRFPPRLKTGYLTPWP